LRKGQTQRVIIYRIIAKGTTDVLLNNIGFSKEVIQSAFTGGTKLRA
jgi:hypothetical protein